MIPEAFDEQGPQADAEVLTPEDVAPAEEAEGAEQAETAEGEAPQRGDRRRG